MDHSLDSNPPSHHHHIILISSTLISPAPPTPARARFASRDAIKSVDLDGLADAMILNQISLSAVLLRRGMLDFDGILTKVFIDL